MSWAINQGPSFDVIRKGSSYSKLSGFDQRFMLLESDPRMTPGKAHVHLPPETMKGTFKMKKANRKVKKKACKDHIMPKGNPEPTYGGFGKSKPNKASRKVVKPGKPLKKYRVK